MKYKIYVSGYLEESNQLLVSFSSDETKREAKDYPSLAFDVVPYGDISADDILLQIAKTAPTLCHDTKVAEDYEGDDSRAAELRSFVGREFEFDGDDFYESQAAQEREQQTALDAEQAEEI